MSDQYNQAGSTDPRVQVALREYFERMDRGEAVNRDEFLARHAEIAGELRSFFAGEEQLREITVTKLSEESASISTRSFAAQGQETVPPRLQSDRSPATSGNDLQGRFGRYQIIQALGKGAMGAVYLAHDTQLKRHVAIKTPRFDDDPTGELLKRFYREAEAAATLRHANICPIYDVGQIEGRHFISMAYIEGRTLSDVIHNGESLNERQIMIVVQKLAQGLQHAHDHGIVHRDLKPANIMVDSQGEPIIMDFGLARKARNDGEASLTECGVILGSPAYMSPEQIEGGPESIGPASDQHSLGVILYEMLTGQIPFRGSVVNVLAQVISKEPARPTALRPEIDSRIEAVCLQMMAKKASDRFPSLKAVVSELATISKNTAGNSELKENRATAHAPPMTLDRSQEEAGSLQSRQSVEHNTLTEGNLTSLAELVRGKKADALTKNLRQIIEARDSLRGKSGQPDAPRVFGIGIRRLSHGQYGCAVVIGLLCLLVAVMPVFMLRSRVVSLSTSHSRQENTELEPVSQQKRLRSGSAVAVGKGNAGPAPNKLPGERIPGSAALRSGPAAVSDLVSTTLDQRAAPSNPVESRNRTSPDVVPLRRVGAKSLASVTINGGHIIEMIVDPGSTWIILSHKDALICGVKIGDSASDVAIMGADGSYAQGKTAILVSVRVGRSTAQNVLCVVLPASDTSFRSTLGMTFLEQFEFDVTDGTSLKLSAPRETGQEGKK
jgi:clan AA aspartic protease (TIGR02281 family)